jgi:hypothetical protein
LASRWRGARPNSPMLPGPSATAPALLGRWIFWRPASTGALPKK